MRLVLPKCRAAGETRVLITCEADNIASRKTILRAGGRLENTLETTERYWIDLKAQKKMPDGFVRQKGLSF